MKSQRKYIKRVFIFLLVTFLGFPLPSFSAEPSIGDYAHVPIFMTESVKPNILILLDNSGSMNYNAYGPEKWSGELVDDTYYGYPYTEAASSDYNFTASSNAEQETSTGRTRVTGTGGDLDFGYSNNSYPNQSVGVRFSSVNIPPGATITNAYLQFSAVNNNQSGLSDLSVTIYGNDVGDADAFVNGSSNYDVTNRATTSNSVSWTMGQWTNGNTYNSPDVASIIQEIVDRSDWVENNSLAFIFNVDNDPAGNYRSASSLEGANAPTLVVEIDETAPKEYYGYFNPDYFYEYSGGKFVHKYKKGSFDISSSTWTATDLLGHTVSLTTSNFSNEGLWDGNWMNWMCMRRIDVLRKVLMGGDTSLSSNSRDGSGSQTIYGEYSVQSSRYFDRNFNSSTVPVTPYSGTYRYRVERDADLTVDTNQNGSFSNSEPDYNIAIAKEEAYDTDAFGDDHNLSGLIQDYYDNAYWGLEFYNSGNGGIVTQTMSATGMESLLQTIEGKGSDTSTPLAESFYTGMLYFKQESPDHSLNYSNSAVPISDAADPYKRDGEDVYCAKSFVLLLSDGAPTNDNDIPSEYSGLPDIALEANTTDLRSDMADEQNLKLYTVYALSDDPDARALLKDAARSGGFNDYDDDGVPDGDYDSPADERLEWDSDGDAIPDTYFEATDGAELQDELSAAIQDILKEAASGTAVSVISTATEGDGSLVQAYFRPLVEEGAESMTWTGYLHGLWVDSMGYTREDTNQNKTLDLNADRIVVFDEVDSQTVARRYDVSTVAYPDLVTANQVDYVAFDELESIFSAGALLAERDADTRDIFTFIDIDADQVVDSTELIDFDLSNFESLTPYLGVTSTTWDYLGSSSTYRVKNLIDYIRGKDSGLTGETDVRSRTIDDVTWKLGDIVYSTPIIVAAPQDRYDQTYGDASYSEYYTHFKDRETVVYTGANDGMLHAFTSWYYDDSLKKFTNVLPPIGDSASSTTTSDSMGSELWAYIPQSLLSHLKWLADPDYSHVHYVDLEAKVFDAKILPDDTHYTDSDTENNWGTFLLVGLNYGGKHIWAEGDFDGDGSVETRHFYPTYTMIDVTDPRNPNVIWERTYSQPSSPTETASNDTDLGLTMQVPSIVKVNDSWFAIFGSGPNDYSVESLRNGHIYVVDLATGTPYQNGSNDWLFETSDERALMAQAASYDKNLNYSVDSIFMGESFDADSGSDLDWQGAMYKIRVPWTCSGTCSYYGDLINGSYDANPLNWQLSKVYSATRPITSAPTLSVDDDENSWIYFGTGRYYTEADKLTTDADYLIGIKDPFFDENAEYSDDYYLETSVSKTLDAGDLLDSNAYAISNSGVVYEYDTVSADYEPWGSFWQLEAEAADWSGWQRELTAQTGERVINDSSIIGGTLLATTFAPEEDVCESGGSSYLYALYYLTGTAYSSSIFDDDSYTVGYGDDEAIRNIEYVSLGQGISSSPTVHVGEQDDDEVTVFYQKSTGEVGSLEIDPALTVRSSLKLWREERSE
jgi:type IV pilus assembly protein PilY1